MLVLAAIAIWLSFKCSKTIIRLSIANCILQIVLFNLKSEIYNLQWSVALRRAVAQVVETRGRRVEAHWHHADWAIAMLGDM